MSSISPRKAISLLIPRNESPTMRSRQTPQQLIQAQITSLMWKLDNYTVDLQAKVDGLLHQQEEEFFKAYKGYLGQLRSSLTVLEKKLDDQTRKIQEYENSGELSKLIRKNNQYEAELNKMYAAVAEKQKIVQNYKIKIEALQKDNRQLHLSMKLMIKERTQNRMKKMVSPVLDESNSNKDLNCSDPDNNSNHNIFATEIKDRHTDKTHEESLGIIFQHRQPHSNEREKSSISRRRPYYDAEFLKLKKEVKYLREKNESLLKANVQTITQQSEFQQFFLKCINDIKKQICSRNNIPNCEFSDFKKQDKLKLLINIVSNEKIIKALNQVLFAERLKPVSIFQYVEGTIHHDTADIKQEASATAPYNPKHHSLAKVRMHSQEQQKKLPQITDARGLRHKRKKAFPNYMTTKRFSDVY